MYSKNRWLAVSAFFWAIETYAVWNFGLIGVALAALGIMVGWACSVYFVIPSQYRYMVESREGRRQYDYLSLKETLALSGGALVLWWVLDQVGKVEGYGIAIVACAVLGTVFLVGAFSRRLASVSRRGPSESTGERSNSLEDRSKKPHEKRRHRRRP